MDKVKKYAIKEMYLTLQGEGAHSGRTAVFVRFSGCNLWSGLEKDRATAICRFCDTDFWGTDGERGGKYELEELGATIDSLWQGDGTQKYVVFTGGEPALQLDSPLINRLHKLGFTVAIETNGTLPIPSEIDWVCVSPKAGTELIVRSGNELKLVFPQPDAMPEDFRTLDFDHFYLQPMDGPLLNENTAAAITYCLEHPQWRLSTQSHKFIGIK